MLRWRCVVWLHVPAALWAVLIELSGWICPLTPLENRLRELGGEAGYSGSFVERYLVPALYPPELTRDVQVALGLLVLLVNGLVYWWVYAASRSRTAGDDGEDE